MNEGISIDVPIFDKVSSALERLEARLAKLAPEYELLSDIQAAARFNLPVRKITELRLSANGPRAAVEGKDARVSVSEWVAFFQREERRKGVRQ